MRRRLAFYLSFPLAAALTAATAAARAQEPAPPAPPEAASPAPDSSAPPAARPPRRVRPRSTSPIFRTGLNGSRWGLRAGAFFPVGRLADEMNRHSGFTASLSYDLQPYRRSRFVSFAAYAETATAGRPLQVASGRFYRDTLQDNVTMTGVGLSARAASDYGRHGQVFAVAGAGLYRLDRATVVRREDLSGFNLLGQGDRDWTQTVESRHQYRAGMHLGAGVLFARGFSAEARLLDLGAWRGVPYRGVTVHAGLRF